MSQFHWIKIIDGAFHITQVCASSRKKQDFFKEF